MRRVSRPWSLLVLIALLGLVGPPATASASDAGLRGVVRTDQATDKRLVAAGNRLGKPSSRSFEAYARFVRRVANYYAKNDRAADAMRRRYTAQQPQTAAARRGRLLAIRGHRDVGNASSGTAAAYRRGIARMAQARSEGAYQRAFRRMVRGAKAQGTRFRRGNSRVLRGRKLILTAPAPSAPAPATPAPATPAPAAPAPAPALASPPAPQPLLPSLPLLPPLLGG